MIMIPTVFRFVRFCTRRSLRRSSSLTLRNDSSRGTTHPRGTSRPLRCSRFKRFADRRTGGRDGRSRIPRYSEQPEPTPYVKELVDEYAKQAAAEREAMERDTAPWRQDLAQLIDQLRHEVHPDPAVRAHRQRDASHVKRKLEEAIASRRRQYVDRRNQLAAHTCVRIETYWDRLVQVHPDGELLTNWINKWKPPQLAGPLGKLIEIDELNGSNEPSEFDGPSEIN